jgi:hypothetical protein
LGCGAVRKWSRPRYGNSYLGDVQSNVLVGGTGTELESLEWILELMEKSTHLAWTFRGNRLER